MNDPRRVKLKASSSNLSTMTARSCFRNNCSCETNRLIRHQLGLVEAVRTLEL